MARLGRLQLPTYRFEVSIRPLSLKQINDLRRKIPNKSGKIRKRDANALRRKGGVLKEAAMAEVRNDP